MFEIFSRAKIIINGKEKTIIFSTEEEKKYYLDNIKECKKELSVVKKLKLKVKTWEKNLKEIEKLKDNLNKSHKSFGRSVKVEALEKPSLSVFKRRKHNYKDTEKDNKELEYVKKEAAKKSYRKRRESKSC